MEKDRSKKILVTGSGGFIGRHLLDKLSKEGVEYIGCDLNSNVNILNLGQVMDMPEADTVIHLAANTNVSGAFLNPYEIYHDNILGTLNVMEYCRVKKVKKIVYLSSYVYGVPQYLPIDEKHPIMIDNPYGRSKMMSESLVTAFCEDFNIKAVVLRCFNIYGTGQNRTFLIPFILEQLLSESDTIQLNDLSPKRDFIYIKDVIEAIWKCCGREDLAGVNIFNVGCGRSYSVEEVLEIMFKISGKRKIVSVLGAKRKNEIPDSVANIGKIKNGLDWKPVFSLEDGLKDMFKSQRGAI